MIESGCKHQGNEVFSSRLLIALAEATAKLGRNLDRKAELKLHGIFDEDVLTGHQTSLSQDECGGHSDRETPEPFPNSEDKPVHVLYCTQMRELSGNTDRCHAHLNLF